MLENYYDRFDPAKNYERHLFRPRYPFQSAEANEIQSASIHRLRGIADALFRDGDVIRDAQVIIDPVTGETICQSGAVYLSGAVRGVAEARITIPTVGTVAIGIYLTERVITEVDDPSLRDPAVGTRSYQEPGAARLQVTTAWGFEGDGQDGDFFSIYVVDDGSLRVKTTPPQLDTVTQALAKYDRDSSGGSYVVSGMRVARGEDTAEGKQTYTVTEGSARVNGHAIERDTSRRLVYDAIPDRLFIDSEPHPSPGPEQHWVALDRHPVGRITAVRITTERTVVITHAAFTGSSDPLPDNAVIALILVKQGDVTYSQGTDYKLTAGQVNWSPGGAEPSPGSAYSVTYQCITTIQPHEPTDRGLYVSGAITDSLILVSYDYLLPRYDRLLLTADGDFQFIQGVASQWQPVVPEVPAPLLPLATLHQTWDEKSRVIIDTIRAVPMSDLYALEERLDAIVALIAQQRLEVSAGLAETGFKKGILVDPFIDDSVRDNGITQTAIILAGELQLDVAVTVLQTAGDIPAPRTLTYQSSIVPDDTVIEQGLRTGAMKVNPYDAFEPIPNQVTLNPAFDAWTTTQKVQSVDKTTTESLGLALQVIVMGTTSSSRTLDTMRSIDVSYDIRGWDSGELVAELRFDGLPVAPTGQNWSSDHVTGKFRIPAGVSAGKKEVLFFGTAGSYAAGTYTGSQTATIITESIWNRYYDPLAQTFTPPANCSIAAVDLWFTARSAKPNVMVQIRETANGVPTRRVLAETRVDPASILVNGNPTRIPFDTPVHLLLDTEYALVVLCDDAVTSLAIAELGKYDATTKTFVTSQPYQIGVLLSSSNASTWTPHQDKDLTFRLLRARYTATEQTVNLGTIQIQNASDLILLSPSVRPETSAQVRYKLTLPDDTVLTVDSGQHSVLDDKTSGTVTVEAVLSGTANVAPTVWPGTQLVNGELAMAGDYVTRAITAGQNSRVKVIFDALIPAGATVTPSIAGIDQNDSWSDTPSPEKALQLDEGFVELTYAWEDVDEAMIRARLILTGTPSARPRVRNLRVIVL
jgi:hypothetical protein